MKRYIIFILAVGLMLLTFDSCQTEKTESKETPTKEPETKTPVAGQSAVADDVSEKNIVQTAAGSKDFSTLVAAVKAAGLTDVLSNAGPFTVFAPTNAAFDKLPTGTIEDLLKPEKKETLQDILQYHVTVGVYKAEALQDGQILGLSNGGTMKITKKNGKLVVNGVANIITSIPTSNGLIHVIDAVLLPRECCVTHKSQWCNVCD